MVSSHNDRNVPYHHIDNQKHLRIHFKLPWNHDQKQSKRHFKLPWGHNQKHIKTHWLIALVALMASFALIMWLLAVLYFNKSDTAPPVSSSSASFSVQPPSSSASVSPSSAATVHFSSSATPSPLSSSGRLSSSAIGQSSSAGASDVVPLILAMGQSNNQGEGCCVNSSIDNGYPNMLQYYFGDGDGYGSLAPTAATIAAKWELTPANEILYDGGTITPGGVGNLVALGRQYTDVYDPATLILVQASIGSTSIAQWNATLFARAVAGVTNVTLLSPSASIVFVTWIQGEADISNAEYQSDLIAFISATRTTMPTVTATTPFVIGSMLPEYAYSHTSEQTIYDIHRAIPNLVPYTAFRNSPYGYMDVVEGESIHYSASGQRCMGTLLFQGYQDALLNTQVGLIPNHPTGLTAALTASQSITLQWTAPTVNPTAAVTNYLVTWKLYDYYVGVADGDPSAPLLLLTNSTSTSFTFPNGLLQINSLYQFDVSAVSGTQRSSGSWDSWLVWSTALPITTQSTTVIASYTSISPFFVLPAQTNLTNIIDGYNQGAVSGVTFADSMRGYVANFNGANFITPYYMAASYSICVWFYIKASNNFPWGFVSMAYNGIDATAFVAGVGDSGVLEVQRILDVATSTFQGTTYQIPNYNSYMWFHVCYTYNSSTGYDAIYLNGVLVASNTFVNTVWNGTHVQIGAGYALAGSYFGSMQGLAIWNSSISSEQVQSIYQKQQVINQVSQLNDYL